MVFTDMETMSDEGSCSLPVHMEYQSWNPYNYRMPRLQIILEKKIFWSCFIDKT